MPSNWNKGQTKNTNLSVKKISDTMKSRKMDNFKAWRDGMKAEGKIKSNYLPLEKSGDLAELIGVVLGDGHICVYPRCEELRLVSNSNSSGFVERYSVIMEKVFNKGSSGHSPEVLSELASLAQKRDESRGIGPIFRRRSDAVYESTRPRAPR